MRYCPQGIHCARTPTFAVGAAASAAAAHGAAGAHVSVWPLLLLAALAGGLHRALCHRRRPRLSVTFGLLLLFQGASHLLLAHHGSHSHHGHGHGHMLATHMLAAGLLTGLVHAVEMRLWVLAVMAAATAWVAWLCRMMALAGAHDPHLFDRVRHAVRSVVQIPLVPDAMLRLPSRRGPPTLLLPA